LSLTFLEKRISWPLVINAITGGTDAAFSINQCLAGLAHKYNIPMAVGSLNIAFEQPSLSPSFAIVREKNPDGLIFANIGANESPDKAFQAVEMIKADALQLHFNVPQEIAMREGERNFKNILANVKAIVDDTPVPIIAKEVGFGFSRETAEKLFDCGVRIFDNGGQEDNFIAIENHRSGQLEDEFNGWAYRRPGVWGKSRHCSYRPNHCMGGIRSALDAAKALAMGADMIGMAAPLLKKYMLEGEEGVESFLNRFLYSLKAAALMTGSRNLKELAAQPLIILGQTAEWLRARGIDPGIWVNKKQ
jgi:isopentenyl-diphosphate delta-isomerase